MKLRSLLNEGRHASWIGADDRFSEGTWRNVKGEKLTYLPWSAGQPDNMNNQDCAWLGINRFTMRWDDQHCGQNFKYAVCHRSKITDGIKITSKDNQQKTHSATFRVVYRNFQRANQSQTWENL